MAGKSQADERRERFVAHQASLPKDQRLDIRQDLNQVSSNPLAKWTLRQYRYRREAFLEFLEVCRLEEYDPKFYEKDGHPQYGPEVFKAFAVYLSQSIKGRINGKISILTLTAVLNTTWSLIEKERRCQFLSTDKDNVRNFIRTDLALQEDLSTEMLAKPTAFAADTSHVFSILYNPQFLVTLCDMRRAFNITLFINLMIDAANRGGDMVFRNG